MTIVLAFNLIEDRPKAGLRELGLTIIAAFLLLSPFCAGSIKLPVSC